MYPPSQAAYDRALTVFSPDGRLFQVEYAREAVRVGSTSVGITGKDSVALVGVKRLTSGLVVPESHEKVFVIDNHVAASFAGLAADARKLTDVARVEAQKHRLTYNEEMPVEMLSKKVGEHLQFYTQYGGVRPYGVSLLIGGVDDKPHLFETDPFGLTIEYYATAIGAGKKAVEDFLEKEYKQGLKTEDAIKLGFRALKKVSEEKLTPENVDVAVITKDPKRVHMMTREEIAQSIGEK
ncbi:MAG TPA: archaeal proteasome endopeptidase complex subunit alpha [Candidatus Norongarragalinales archaeon]|jgi:proteasome alpha subunit|nr:archaeal proteasome endopeptidase complex subunit alpha [Candidatus Norongarragalinales archaeon]